jgi:hypothetical protein
MDLNFDKCKELAESYFRGTNKWLDSQFLTDRERHALAERFAEGLFRYKELVNAFCDDKTNGGTGVSDSVTAKIDSLKAWGESLPQFVQGGI